MNERDLARNLSVGRIALGGAALITTRLFGLLFAGREVAEDPVNRIAGRLFGIREIAIGLATIDALDKDQPAKRLLQLGLMCDAADFLSVLAGARALPWRGRVLGLGLAAGFGAIGVKVSSALA